MIINKKPFLLSILFIAFLLPGCKYLEDTTVAKYYHNITSHYNIYFNAEETMKSIIRMTEESHIDNYNSILDVLMFGTDDMLKKNATQVDNILKKCAKILEKHPGSKWVDDCYFLMAKAYFYKADYYAAIETFNYVQTKYKNADLAYEAMIWVALCNLKLGKNDEALAQLTLVKSEQGFPRKLEKELFLVQAFVDVKLEDYPAAIEHLNKAILKEKKRNYKTRYIFILGQLYQKTDQLPLAVEMYNKVIKRNPQYDMAFNAKINLSHCYDINDERNARSVRNRLLKMLKDDKNIQYQDQIYFELALLESKLGRLDEMEKYLRLSLEKSKSNENQKALAFLMLGNYYYEHSNYMLAKNYFDSCSTFITETLPDYKKIKERTKILTKLIGNLVVIQAEDSLQYLASLSPARLDSVIDKAYENEQKVIKEKLKQEQELKRKEEMDYTLNTEIVRNKQMLMPGIQTQPVSSWYFSNPQNVSMGISEFQLKWGKRKLEDDWRRKKKTSTVEMTDETGETESDTIGAEEEKVELSEEDIKVINARIKNKSPEKLKYYKDIPFTAKLVEVSNNRLILAYKAVGDIYIEDLGDTVKAVETYEKLITRFPGNKYETEVRYYLYGFYSADNKTEKADIHKNYILEKYPESDYAMLIRNPDFFRNRLKTQNMEAGAFYENYYQLFQSGNCKALIDSAKKAKERFMYTRYYPKIEYLRIICMGKDTSRTVFISMLKEFVKKYKSNEVVTHAQNLLDFLEENDSTGTGSGKGEKSIVTPYIYKPDAVHYFIVSAPNSEIKNIKTGFSNYNAEFHELEELNIATVVMGSNRQLLIVKEFSGREAALKYLKEINSDENFRKKLNLKPADIMVISSQNCSLLISLQDINQYRDFYKLNYK